MQSRSDRDAEEPAARPPPGLMPADQIRAALVAARDSLAAAEAERGALDRRIETVRSEMDLLEQLLRLRSAAESPASRPPTADADADVDVEAANETTTSTSKYPAVEVVITELKAAGRPIHISDLMRILEQNLVPIPGSGSQANLISHLRRDDRLVRPSRGMYGLASWGLSDVAFTRRRRKRTKVRSTSKNRSIKK